MFNKSYHNFEKLKKMYKLLTLVLLNRGIDSQGEEVKRSYTPITLDSDVGYFDLVVKVNFL